MKNNNAFGAILIIGIALFVSCEKSGKFGAWSGNTIVGIQPFGSIAQEEIDSVQLSIEKMYDFEVVVLNSLPLPNNAYTEIRYPRYRADTLVQWLTDHKPDSVNMVIGLTNKDISITKYKKGTKEVKEPTWQYRDFGIYGLGRINGSACVVSSNRLHKNGTKAQFYKRLTRISCHEIGHVLGLHHCPEQACLMNDANEKITTIDNSTGVLCESCWKKID